MKLSSAAVLAILVGSSTPVFAQFPIPPSPPPEQTGIHCQDFRQLSNGAWTPVRRVTLTAPQGPFTVEPGESFGIETGGHLFNLRIARILNDQCR
ncbi:hypothetical protein [Methylocystis heyeri]|uniref:Uncharacterized protein n=1 Tax=Methylocystis heyeri TaxID=391905 RepID=A0A6B8KKF5_9HYPH|nr:hypothetical protein [Methylocystis heyeri]QGM47093.1 hypothetical protein H2LOC_016125 [Methylocystis heyeri]